MQFEFASAVVIYDSVLYNRGGQVDRWARSLERRFVLHAKAEAPARSGELRALISGDVDMNPFAKQALTTIVSDAPHSLYVLGGTTGPIMSRRLWGFRQRTGLDLPRGGRGSGGLFGGPPNMAFLKSHGYALRLRPGNGHGQLFKLQVSGQEQNNFFARAAERTAVTNRSLRGFNPRFGY